MEPEQSESVTTNATEKVPVEQSQPEVRQHKKNPKRVEAGKKLAERNKKEKEKMLADIALANAKASETDSALKSYLEQQRTSTPTPPDYLTPGLFISGVLVLVGLYIWASRPKEKPSAVKSTPVGDTPKPVLPPVTSKPVVIEDDDMYSI